jgi:uncharacterized membrane protein YdbT with pleckstrin-like domain
MRPRKGFWNGKGGLRHKSQQQEVHMLMDNVIAGIAIGVFSFVLVIVAKLAAIAVHLMLKNWIMLKNWTLCQFTGGQNCLK